ncbi:hypothetical protein K443DRAFT_273789 [Laccaria amethystina LaAM-08-1]|uniref:Uncharacterized protein n=1 Tax=Laccaria amethystina LaAM-08-1 TaxID=1095629 RepID=A0A0C9XKR0_9AGAR|nr:hypothetical protein K443DRAFT_273789 [Laccaria amethystina LaAM-08-1]
MHVTINASVPIKIKLKPMAQLWIHWRHDATILPNVIRREPHDVVIKCVSIVFDIYHCFVVGSFCF